MALMGRAAFLIVPSIWYDPCPTVAIEALSRGTPVLATRMGGLPELVDERCGWTVAPTIENALGRDRPARSDEAAEQARRRAGSVPGAVHAGGELREADDSLRQGAGSEAGRARRGGADGSAAMTEV